MSCEAPSALFLGLTRTPLMEFPLADDSPSLFLGVCSRLFNDASQIKCGWAFLFPEAETSIFPFVDSKILDLF
jgi:hypothetical protein